MATKWTYLVLSLYHLCNLSGFASCCGISTHIEISYRAQDSFKSTSTLTNFGQLLLKHQDALEGGSTYPDAFYDTICFGGKYHNISEDTHWTPFMNATINYIRHHYPPPWDQATEKLVVFLLGIVSHQTADISWHGLGIEQGFLDAMGAINFHGSFDAAHPVGDVGGDVMTLFEFNMSYLPYLSEWYVPVDDLYSIYTELYGAAIIPKSVIFVCTLQLYAERLGEKLAIGKLYPDYAKKSPFLVDQLTNYFLGGLDDMAVWTQRVWRHAILMLEQGTKACRLDHNPLFVTCDEDQRQGMVGLRNGRGGKPERNGFYTPSMFRALVGKEDVRVTHALRGFVFSPGPQLQKALLLKGKQQAMADMKKEESQNKLQRNQKTPDAVYFVNSSYARLGQALVVGDLDGDGNDDVVIGAPGYRSNGSPQDGAVFVLFGTEQGLPLATGDLVQSAQVVLLGENFTSGRLGSSVTIVDINQDGLADIAAGAPSTGSTQLSYNGTVEVFYGVGQRHFVHNMTVTCQDHYCNLGRSLAAADIDGDSHPDLLIGSPFSGAKGDQRGLITAIMASRQYQGRTVQISVSALQWKVYGSQNYSWFGQSITASEWKSTFLLVTEPAWRACDLPNCSFTERDLQAVGQLNIFTAQGGQHMSLAGIMRGTQALQAFGSSASLGTPLKDHNTVILAVGAPGQDVAGTIAGVPVKFPQAGAVWLYNLSDPHLSPLAIFSGDRRFSRFGLQIKFADVNSDGYDDLLVGAPMRTEDLTEEIHAGEEGAAYLYYGGPSFPLGPNATSHCPHLSLVTPCPAATASVVLKSVEDKARQGSQFAVVKSKAKVQVLVTAAHSSHGGRLSGAVAVYSFLTH